MSAYYLAPTVGGPQQARSAAQNAQQNFSTFLDRVGNATLQLGLVSFLGGGASLILGIFGYSIFTAVGVILGGFGILILIATLLTHLLSKLAAALNIPL